MLRFGILTSSLLLLNLVLYSAAAAGTLEVLTYNVAGLPELLSSSHPSVNTPYISARLGHYQVVHVEEDFNYHGVLYASDPHAYRTPTSGGVPFGSGLNTLSDFPYVDLARITWTHCYYNSGDCLTPKGFTSMRINLGNDVWVDFYNLHTDAGSKSGDLAARASNVAQIVYYINTFSAGMPVILMGDTNMRYSNALDSARALVSGGGFTDAWVSSTRGGIPPALGTPALTCKFPFASNVTDQATMLACEVVDKILFRSSPTLNISLNTLTNEHLNFLNPTNGKPLSDHYPLSAVFSYTTTSLRFSPIVGGPHGNYFNDIPTLTAASAVPKITTLTLSGGARVDRITTAYNTISSITHGGTGGTATSITVGGTEIITEVEACEGKKNGHTRVFYLRVKTSTAREIAVGVMTSTCTVMTPPETGMKVVGFWGRSGDELDRVGLIWG